jgi:small-conductance mechanosensitive channel
VAPAWAAGLGGLLLFAIGAGVGGDDARTAEEAVEVVTETVTEGAVGADAEEVADERRRLNRVKDDMADTREQLADTREQLQERDRRLDDRKDRLDQRAANLDERGQQLAAVPAPEPESVYYDTCSDAEAAGDTPLYAGDPGYADHLDADGDGVACE